MPDAVTELPFEPLERLRQRESAKWRTYPPDVLPLFVAEMDVALAEPVRQVLADAVARSDTGYAMAAPSLGRAVASFCGRRWGWELDQESVVAVADVGVGVVELLRALTSPGDVIAFSTPVYPPFWHWVDEVRCRPAEVPLTRTDHGWRLDLSALETVFAERRPAAFVLCNPHNPVGRVHGADELAALAELAARHGVVVVSDEIHAPLVLDGASFTPFLSVPGGADVGVAVLSASKAWNLAGLKCAAVVTGSDRMHAVVDQLPVDAKWRAGHLGVLASVAALDEGGPWLDSLLVALAARRAQLAALLRERLPAVRWVPPEATYLAWLDCAALGAADPWQQALERGRVALEAGLRFGPAGEGFLRLNFATGAAVLDDAVARMAVALG